jgi:hypothetical protein
MDHVWVGEKMLRILCTSDMHDAAHDFANMLNSAMWHDDVGFNAQEHLAHSRERLLAVATTELK